MGFAGSAHPTALMRVGICNPDPNVMSTDHSPAVAQNVTDGITNPVRRSVGRIQGCDPPNVGDRSITFGGTRPWFRPRDLTRVGMCNPDPNGLSTGHSLAAAPKLRVVGRIQGCDPPNADDRSIAFGGTRPWFRPTDLVVIVKRWRPVISAGMPKTRPWTVTSP